MTAQIPDSLLWDGTEHDIVAIDDVWPFSPREHGLAPVSPHTACWRGYVARYAIASGRLVLRTLRIGTEAAAAARVWCGVQPSRGAADEMWEYENVDLPVRYSGGMVIATELRSELYVHRGFQPPYAYEGVLELAFVESRVVSVADRSSGMARIRGLLERTGGLPAKVIRRLTARVFAASYEDCSY